MILQRDFGMLVEFLHKLPPSALPTAQDLIRHAQAFQKVSPKLMRRFERQFELQPPLEEPP